MARRESPEINASSMADIAFLLLIFFLVTTTIDTDKGMLVKLPQWVEPDELPPPDEANKRNVLEILVNRYDQLLVDGELMTIENLKKTTKKFVANNGDGTCSYCQGSRDPNMSDNPQKAIVSLKNDRATSYDMYISVYNELQAAYNELRDESAMKEYGKPFDDLNDPAQTEETEKDKIRDKWPMRISEAEPEAYGEEN
ncbi:MAG: biopolymer transporter ExbD [Bacteroidetes bacterium]|nr:biopolymer transporter ExbD [Bacteroidota bacterium]